MYVSRDLCNPRLISSYKLNGSNVPVVSIFFHCIHIGLKCLLKLLFSIKDKSLSSPITIFSFFHLCQYSPDDWKAQKNHQCFVSLFAARYCFQVALCSSTTFMNSLVLRVHPWKPKLNSFYFISHGAKLFKQNSPI